MPTDMDATLVLFGFPSTKAHLTVLERTPTWRVTRSVSFAAGGLALAPVVGLLPPHAPWALASLVVGGVMAFRKWTERITVVSLEGACPKCGGKLALSKRTRLQGALTVPCPGCRYDSRLVVPVGDPSQTNREPS